MKRPTAYDQGATEWIGDGDPALAKKVVAVDRALTEGGVPHAVGGAVALAYHSEPRATIDIDVNVFVPVESWPEVRRALERTGVEIDPDGEPTADREIRLAWDRNSVHLFFSYDALHDVMPDGVRRVPFAGASIPIVSAEHLVVRKVTLDRPKDWLDIEDVLIANDPLDLAEIEGWVRRLAGDDDPRVAKLEGLIRRLVTSGRQGDHD